MQVDSDEPGYEWMTHTIILLAVIRKGFENTNG